MITETEEETLEPTATLLLEARDIHKTYRRGPEEVHALRGVSFRMARGEVVALVGPSGSGKTTLLNVLCGWEHADRGEVAWAHDRSRVPPEARPWKDLAIVPQDLGLIEELSVRENVELPLRLSGRLNEAGEKRAVALLTAFGLEAYENRAPGEVSLGEQQRTALCRALVLSPRLLLADEPTGHQDAGWARGVFRAFRMAAREGTSCLVATHSKEGLKWVDRILGIRDGRVWRAEQTEAATMRRPSAVTEADEL
jgi:putative ABC transport system ATP-binding protein